MTWLVGDWPSVWRLHRWVGALYLLGIGAVLAMVASIVTSGFEEPLVWLFMLLAMALQTAHDWVVKRYRRRDSRLVTSS